MTDDGVHSLQSEEGRSAVVGISTPRLWKVLEAFDGGLRSQRTRAAHHRPRRGIPSKTENGILRSVGVDVNSKTASGVIHMLVVSSSMEMLNETRFIAQPRTSNQQQFHLVLVEIGTTNNMFLNVSLSVSRNTTLTITKSFTLHKPH